MKKLTIKDVASISIEVEDWEVSSSYVALELNSDFWRITIWDVVWINWTEAEINIDEIDYLDDEVLEEEELEIEEGFKRNIINLLCNSY